MSSMSDKWVVHNTGIQTNESTSHPNREVRKIIFSKSAENYREFVSVIPLVQGTFFLIRTLESKTFWQVSCQSPASKNSNIAGGRLVDSKIFGKKNSPFVFSLLLKSLKRTCYEDLSKQNLGRKDLGEMLFLLHKKILLAKTKKHPPVATKQRKKMVVVTVISWL